MMGLFSPHAEFFHFSPTLLLTCERWNNECLQPWWGCISVSGVGDIVQIDGIINAEKYIQVLIHSAIPSGKCLIGNTFIFQCHNDPKHTANAVKSYLERNIADKTLTFMDWPPQTEYLEAVWDHLGRESNKRQPKSKEELWKVLKEAWYNLLEDYFRKLQGQSPQKCLCA